MVRLLLLLAASCLMWPSGTEARRPRRRVDDLGDDDDVELLARRAIAHQRYLESIARLAGNSGVELIRPSVAGRRRRPERWSRRPDDDVTPPIHDHPDRRAVLGLADLDVVLNGVRFRTGHTDYRLRRRGRSRDRYEAVPMPPVPPEVTRLADVDEQIAEMRRWFKAWADQDPSKRDYRRYFKPVLCYLEGTWKVFSKRELSRRFHTRSIDKVIEQLRSVWFTELKKWRNGSQLPLTIVKTTPPMVGQWQYDVLCHQLTKDVPLEKLSVVDDVENRMMLGAMSLADYRHSKAARFAIKGTRRGPMGGLDDLMQEIPGLDGYGGRITDNVFERTALRYDTKSPLNAAFYHRWYATKEGIGHRSFSDSTLFVARNTDPRVLTMETKYCRAKRKRCKRYAVKSSFAIPLEIVFLTPLHSWDPYGLSTNGTVAKERRRAAYRGPSTKLRGDARVLVTTALNGSNEENAFLTPSHFFVAPPSAAGPDETGAGAAFVFGADGMLRRVVASGVYTLLPRMAGVGRLRTRYPIMPLHGEGDPAWAELAALGEVILRPKALMRMRAPKAKDALCERETSRPKVNGTSMVRRRTRVRRSVGVAGTPGAKDASTTRTTPTPNPRKSTAGSVTSAASTAGRSAVPTSTGSTSPTTVRKVTRTEPSTVTAPNRRMASRIITSPSVTFSATATTASRRKATRTPAMATITTASKTTATGRTSALTTPSPVAKGSDSETTTTRTSGSGINTSTTRTTSTHTTFTSIRTVTTMGLNATTTKTSSAPAHQRTTGTTSGSATASSTTATTTSARSVVTTTTTRTAIKGGRTAAVRTKTATATTTARERSTTTGGALTPTSSTKTEASTTPSSKNGTSAASGGQPASQPTGASSSSSSSLFGGIMKSVLFWQRRRERAEAAAVGDTSLAARLARLQRLRGRYAVVLVTGRRSSGAESGSRRRHVVLESGRLSELLHGRYVRVITHLRRGRVHPLILYRRGRNIAIKQCNYEGYCRHGHGPFLYRPPF